MTTVRITPDRLALLGGSPARRAIKPKFPIFTDRARARVDRLLHEGPIVGLSKEHSLIREAEETIAAWHDVDLCLCVSTGHAALHATMIGLEIADGDEVITSPYSWGATTSAILVNNAIPVFADVDPVTGLLDPGMIAEQITARTRAIMVPHIYGQPANMTSICEIAEEHGIFVVEDGSQAHGARHRGQRVGGFGHAAGFSCMGGKPLGTTEAGYMLAARPEIYWKAAISCQHPGGSEAPGRSSELGFPSELAPYIDSLLYTYRPSTVNAILLVEQLVKLDAENEARRANLADLLDKLSGVRSISVPSYREGDEPALHMVTLNFDVEAAGVSRDTYLTALRAEGVPAFVYIQTPLHRAPRLSPRTTGPRVMWTENLRRHGVDYTDLVLPNVDRKIAASIELNWNYIDADPAAMSSLADAFIKLEENLDELRTYERKTTAV